MWNIYKENDEIKYTQKEVENVLFTVDVIPPRVEEIGYITVLRADEAGKFIYWDYIPDPNYVPPAPEPTMADLNNTLNEIKAMVGENSEYADGYKAAMILLGGEDNV